MKLSSNLIIAFSILLFSCQTSKDEVSSEEPFEYSTWITASDSKTDEDYAQEFKTYKEAGLDAVLINTGGNAENLAQIVPIARKAGLKVHAWIMLMNRPGDKVALQHPEWYTVSRDGKSCYDTRPYVDYYQWLCPTRDESRNHVLSLVENLSKIEDIESVHLDYIRFSDIFLPIALLPKYDLVQNEELPEFDFCYCDVCVSEFEKIHHKNPREMENPAIDMEWKNFRLNAIKRVVDEAYEIVHKNNKRLTAAVFPYPEMADHMVRQRWDKWNIDAVYPMIYHGFYNEELDWISFATKQGLEDVKGRGIDINTGVFIPSFNNADELKEAIEMVKATGAKGISFFDGPAIKQEYLDAIKNSKASN